MRQLKLRNVNFNRAGWQTTDLRSGSRMTRNLGCYVPSAQTQKKTNPFTTGCTNFRTSTLLRHQSLTDQSNALCEKEQQQTFRQAVKTAFDSKKQAIVSAMKSVHWLCKEKIATSKYSSLLNLLKVQGYPDVANLHSGDRI